MISSKKAPGLVAALLLGFGCSGQIGTDRAGGSTDNGGGGGDSHGTGGAGGTTPKPMPGPDGVIDSAGPFNLRRLTVLEYTNTIRDLLGVTISETDRHAFAADQVLKGGFGNGANLVTSVDSRQFLDVSTKVADAAAADLAKLMPKDCAAPAAAAEQGCITKFIETFGLRAFRRPVSSAESMALSALYAKLRGGDMALPYGQAVHDLVLAIVQSPSFLYRWELDGQPIKDGGLIKFGPYEIASRLSYFLWASMPDEALFTAAKAGQLSTPEQISAQADRMLKEAKAGDGLHDFHMQWLGIYGVDELEKDPVFATYSQDVGKAMLGESAAFIDNVFQTDGKLETLLTSTTSFVNADLAKHYGVSGVTGTGFQKVELNPNQRAGILTLGGFLARHSKEVDSFPIGRGLGVLRQVLCQEIPEPMIQLPPPPEQKMGVTTRKLYEDFTSAAACQACHGRINGTGFALENYDAAGGYRDMEEGQKVDSSGSLELPSGTLTFKNGLEFVKAAAKTPEARDCVARNWMRSLLRRDVMDVEGGSLKAVKQAFESSSFDMRKLIVGLTKTRAFTHRSAVGN
jgi:hypothetical protein